ncbi:MAG: S-methyl-5-thioribose-1-phosphate isomerase [Oscillospiraceae bacterium]|nr:S-methyl-5-thioribose-1-phosphate isomerase [Oscillospiraceae bacterium]
MHEIINVRLSEDGSAVIILDQTLLPAQRKFLHLRHADTLYEAIVSLRVRGAPAIGIFAAYALYVIARGFESDRFEDFNAAIKEHSALLDSSRPTAVNLSTQLRRMTRLVDGLSALPIPDILEAMRAEAEKIQIEDIEMCRAISEHGLSLIGDGSGIMTHCNAGPLATSLYGTALGPILLAHEMGLSPQVYCCETRPLLQGARLTAYELFHAGVDTTLICDNMASIVMASGKVDAIFVGCDRVAMNGDTANKVGTSGLAVLAKHYGVPFYVCCPSSTIDPDCPTGMDIEIELRDPAEITSLYFEDAIAPDGVKCYNPAFDVTDHQLITAIITEHGVCHAPYSRSLVR